MSGTIVSHRDRTRKQFKEKNITEQNQFLLDLFQIMTTKEENISGRAITNHMIVGKRMQKCNFQALWCLSQQFSSGVTKSKRKPIFRDESD